MRAVSSRLNMILDLVQLLYLCDVSYFLRSQQLEYLRENQQEGPRLH